MTGSPQVPMTGNSSELVDVATRPGYCPELASHFLPGVAKDRIILYFAKLMPATEKGLDLSYWKQMFDEYYVPTGTMRMLMMNEDTKQRQKFDIACEFLPYFFSSCATHSMRVMRMQFTEMREYACDPSHPPPPPQGSYESSFPEPCVDKHTTHIVESNHMLLMIVYENGWQCHMVGMFRALLTPYTKVHYVPAPPGIRGNADGLVARLHTNLRIQYLCFSTLAKRMYVPFDEMMGYLETREIPPKVVEQILEYGKTMKRDKDSSESSSDERPSKKIHMDSPQLSNGQEQCMDLSLPLMYSYSDRESCCEPLPQFFLPRPRLSSLRVLDGHGFPPEMVPFVNVRISDCSLSYMLTVIPHPCPDA